MKETFPETHPLLGWGANQVTGGPFDKNLEE